MPDTTGSALNSFAIKTFPYLMEISRMFTVGAQSQASTARRQGLQPEKDGDRQGG